MLWVIIGVTYLVFLVDYLVRLGLAKPRAAWFRGHLLDLAIVVIPMLRALRLLRVLTAMTFGKQTAGTVLRSRIAIYGAGASLLVIYLCAIAVLDVERGAPGANIETFGEALWWAFVTVDDGGLRRFLPGDRARPHLGSGADGGRHRDRRHRHGDRLVVGHREGGARTRRRRGGDARSDARASSSR